MWPLGPDVGVLAAKRVADNAVEAAELALACEEDGRRRRPLLRALEKAQLASEKLGAELEFGAEAELALWRELWATPQAVEWERAHAFRAVAVFVRLQVKGEFGNLDASKEARQWSDRLGMNPLALQRLRQEVERADDAEDRGKRRRTTASVKRAGQSGDDPRSIFSVVS